MCGIVGIVQYESEIKREVRQRALKILFSDIMLKTETRGEDATGIYQVHTDGDWVMSKKGVKSSKWLFQDGGSDDPVEYSDFMESWLDHPQELTALVGHCRKATVGSRGLDNDDNHPFAVQLDDKHSVLGIHNGTLYNHENIFRKLPKFLKRQGRVDSESIFHLMFHLSEHGTKPWDADMMKKLGRRLDGAAACIVVNTRFPEKVATFRFGRPMEYFLITPLNIVVICSERKFVDSALEKYELYRVLFDSELPELEKYYTSLTEKDFRIFDTSKPWPAGSPSFQDLNQISERGDMKPSNVGLEEGWYTPSTKSNTSTGGSNSQHKAGSTPNAAAQAKVTKPAVKALAAGAGSKKEDDTVVVVEVEIGSKEEAERACERATSMGVCTHFDSEQEIAKTIGLTPTEMNALTSIERANLIAKAHFNLGYAVSRFDAKVEIEKNRKGARDLTKRLEKAETKKKKSENRIWELKTLVTLLLGLDDAGYPLTEQNACLSLSAFSGLSDSRRKDVTELIETIFSDKSVQKTVRDLGQQYEDAGQRKQKRTEKAATFED